LAVRFWRERQEVVLLVVLPAAVAIGTAIAAVGQAAAAGAIGAVVVLGAAAAGVILLPLMERVSATATSASARGRHAPRWVIPAMFVGIASVALWSSLGHAAVAGLLAFGAGFLAAFAVVIALKMRARSRKSVVPE
jgi:hypothetical protein